MCADLTSDPSNQEILEIWERQKTRVKENLTNLVDYTNVDINITIRLENQKIITSEEAEKLVL